MVDLAEIERISNGHGSFAIWRDGDVRDISIIKERSADLHGRVIFIGCNPSGMVPPFKNFHSVHRGGHDSWLADSIGKHPGLRGAYMTDFYKHEYSVQESGVDSSDEAIKRNVPILHEELALFKTDNPVVVAFGDKTYKLLTKLGFTPEYLPHYARRGMKREEFILAVMQLGNKIRQFT